MIKNSTFMNATMKSTNKVNKKMFKLENKPNLTEF